MDKEKDEISTRLRLPTELHHKLGVLADIDNRRSLHNYMIKVLQEHVTNNEKELFDAYGEEEFDGVYYSLFGNKYEPYIFKVDSLTEMLNPKVDFHVTKSRIMRQAMGRGGRIKKEPTDRYNIDKHKISEFDEIQVSANKYKISADRWENIELNDDDKPDNS